MFRFQKAVTVLLELQWKQYNTLLVHTYSDKIYTVLCTHLPGEKEVRMLVPTLFSKHSCQRVQGSHFQQRAKLNCNNNNNLKKHC